MPCLIESGKNRSNRNLGLKPRMRFIYTISVSITSLICESYQTVCLILVKVPTMNRKAKHEITAEIFF